MNKKNILNKKTENLSSDKLDWNIIQTEMRNKLGTDIYESWLRKIEFVEELKNYVLLSVSTRFIRDWITSRYLDQILQIIKKYKKDINRIELRISEKKAKDIVKSFSKNTKSEVITLSTLEKKTISKIKAKLISYAS